MRFVSGNGDPCLQVRNEPHVLQIVSADPTVRIRDIAKTVGINERTAAQILCDREKAGYLSKTRDGRRNHYQVHGELPLRHPLYRHHTVGDLMRFLEAPRPQSARRRRTAESPGQPRA